VGGGGGGGGHDGLSGVASKSARMWCAAHGLSMTNLDLLGVEGEGCVCEREKVCGCVSVCLYVYVC